MKTMTPCAKMYTFPEALAVLQEKLHAMRKARPANVADGRCLRLEFPTEPQDILSWIHSRNDPAKIYWTDRDGQFIVGGVGTAHSVRGQARTAIDYASLIKNIRGRLSGDTPHLRYYGGICFDPGNSGAEWTEFGTYRFVIPRFELFSTNGTTTLACNIIMDQDYPASINDILDEIPQLSPSPVPFPARIPLPQKRRDHPTEDQWQSILEKVVASLSQGDYEKIVLARKSTLQFQETVNPFSIMHRLHDITSNCFLFAFQFQKDNVFLGASPELLYERHGLCIHTEAVAGTRPRGISVAEDEQLMQELLNSKKDLHEHKIVVDMIKARLQSLCISLQYESRPSLLCLKGGHHLITKFQGQLLERFGDEAVLSILHPTPAVAGSPTHQALSAIRSEEPFSRGWYTGPLGYLSGSEAKFVVAIRSGLLQNKTLHLYSGAGIVTGSRPQDEWNEIEHKLNTFLKIFE